MVFRCSLMDLTTAGKGVQLMLKRKPRVVEWNSCIDVPLSRGVLVHVLLLDRCTRPAEKRGTAHADLLVGAQVLADQCKQSAGDSIWVSAQSFCNIPSYFIVIDERCDPLCCDGSGRAGPELWVACCPQLLPFLCVINLTASSRICQNENRILVAVFISSPSNYERWNQTLRFKKSA
ncbi:hypothetical protein OUZ56_031063 [Daphnia magna]|uniref:Uncharacterized protein n=1 Tax=Daphnia magna TaxID=35525 RepID=A0ABQ9ZU05_9CRUS|nr:hypothetical protein OUZ56_031063 [Daphnia magna]